MIVRCILPEWLEGQKVLEGDLSESEILEVNALGYNVYFFPNHPKIYDPSSTINGSHIDTFEWVFVDFDLKSGTYPTKQDFLAKVSQFDLLPTKIIDSGNGIHVYWKLTDLDVHSYLKLQRRLCRHFNTDEAVGKICQLMRLPGTKNTKNSEEFKDCKVLLETDKSYTCDVLDSRLPPLSKADASYCDRHYAQTTGVIEDVVVNDTLPIKFGELLRNNKEVKELWSGNVSDRSAADYRIAHIMFASGFTKDEGTSVLLNARKALERAPIHRLSYATNIVDKIWTENDTDTSFLSLSSTVKDIMSRTPDNTLTDKKFPCHRWVDDTEHGFRLGHVLGLVAGSGVGKTSVALNMFLGFVESNPDFVHFFIPLEQPAREVAQRWSMLCEGRPELLEKVHVISNYEDNGGYRHLSFKQIEDYLVRFQEVTKKKVGCVVIDHIGALKKSNHKAGEGQDIMEICHSMKAFAIKTNTLLIMQSQAPRQKAGIGDLELNKDAAFGTVFFESYCDYLITIWQPLKRVYKKGAPTVTSFKFCKIRHKNQRLDVIQEDVLYNMFFDSDTGRLKRMTQAQETSFSFFNRQAVELRKKSNNNEELTYETRTWSEDGTVKDSKDSVGSEGVTRLPTRQGSGNI